MSDASKTGRGRRPGAPDTRAEILASARTLFAARGFANTSVRAVAADAAGDPALVHHYFGTKDDLFMAALQIPVDLRALLAPVVEQGAEGAAERLLRTFLSVWDDSEHQAAFLPVVMRPLAEALGLERPELRIQLVASQIFGLIICRYILRLEPLALMTADQVVGTYAPTLQRYLTGEVP